MKKKYIVLLILLTILLYLFYNNNYYTEKDLIGVYVNNYDEKLNKRMIFPEAPIIKDTLYLYENDRFSSKGLGAGIYSISPAYNSTLISLTSYKNGVKDLGFSTYIRKKNLIGKPCIEMSSDRAYYYEKIK